MIPAGFIIAWPSTAGSIPAGWDRKTAWDTYYIQGAVAGGDADGTARGNATHNHTVTDHTHTAAHTHSLTSTAGGTDVNTKGGGGAPRSLPAPSGHTHTGTTNSASPTINTVAITLNTAANDPPYVKVIWIESDGSPAGIPNGAYAFLESDSLPTNWTRVQGNKFLKGADALGDGGGTGGSSDAHSHTVATNATHTHTETAHSHGAKNCDVDGSVFLFATAGADIMAGSTHVHSVNVSGTGNVGLQNNGTAVSVNNGDGQPVFRKLNIIKNETGGEDLPDGIIGLWDDTNASIPADFSRVTNFDGQFVKGANANGESDVATGGATTHNHTSPTHNHVGTSHTHTNTSGNNSTTVVRTLPYDTGGASNSTHTHTFTVSSEVVTSSSTAVTIQSTASEAHYPPYKRAIFIKYTASASIRLLAATGVGV